MTKDTCQEIIRVATAKRLVKNTCHMCIGMWYIFWWGLMQEVFTKWSGIRTWGGANKKKIVIICNYQWWPQFKLFSHVCTPQKSTHSAKSTPAKCNWTSNVYSTTRCISNSFIWSLFPSQIVKLKINKTKIVSTGNRLNGCIGVYFSYALYIDGISIFIKIIWRFIFQLILGLKSFDFITKPKICFEKIWDALITCPYLHKLYMYF